ncbi:MAG TPA: GNAT family N-acetyltransferase [Niastella sp.]|nr:GNAT family N-acetyltransferase [Niastella sp.]
MATADDAESIAEVITEAAQDLTNRHGQGHWSAVATKRGILHSMSKARVLIAKVDDKVVGTVRLSSSRPWIIDPAYFTPVSRPIYLVDMAVRPGYQRIGVGKTLIEQAKAMAAALTGDSIRLDAYEGIAGAGGFYEKCGFTEMGHILYKKVPHVYFEWLIEK